MSLNTQSIGTKHINRAPLPMTRLKAMSLQNQEAAASDPQLPQDTCDISFGKKALNSGAWAIAGAVVGAASTLLIASAISGPSALGALVFAPLLAGVGAISAGVAGWKMMG